MKDVLIKFDAAIVAALADGRLDEKLHGPLIESARICAATIDATDEPTAAMLTAMLHYFKSLGIIPTKEDTERRRRELKPPTKLDEARARLWKDKDRLRRATMEHADEE